MSNRPGWRGVCGVVLAGVMAAMTGGCEAMNAMTGDDAVGRGNVIFIHPDGASSATWAAARNLYVGPDGDLEWDKLPQMALYRGHMRNSLTSTSHGGATAHAYGIKPPADSFGRFGAGPESYSITNDDGELKSIAMQALRRGMRVGLVQSGTSTEPGTACFVTSVDKRSKHTEIASQLVDSGAHVMLGGGERYFLPEGVEGVWGTGVREDGRNLIEEAEAKGYTVVRTREQLLNLPDDAGMVLGLFADNHTFYDEPEEMLAAQGLPLYHPDAPTIGEMTEAALRLLPRDDRQFLLVVEEEGTDNFGNANNAPGTLEAARRADEAFGAARRYVHDNLDTLIVTAADSDGGGMRLVGITVNDDTAVPDNLPPRAKNGAPIDGVAGTGTAPYIAAEDQFGQRLPFYVVWAAYADVTGGILVRGEGLNSHLIRGSMQNTDITELMRLTLFGDRNDDD